jgi:hypothetical protein
MTYNDLSILAIPAIKRFIVCLPVNEKGEEGCVITALFT